jgi:hypothetical protein
MVITVNPKMFHSKYLMEGASRFNPDLMDRSIIRRLLPVGQGAFGKLGGNILIQGSPKQHVEQLYAPADTQGALMAFHHGKGEQDLFHGIPHAANRTTKR